MAVALLFAMFTMYCNAVCHAQDVARIVVIKPNPGKQQDFQEGYRRHLEWHRRARDSWAWYGWRIVTGDRAGYFMDGTFGHDWDDFDHAINPQGDAQDNALNVAPYADFVSVEHIERITGLSNDRRLEDMKPSRFIEMHRLTIRVGYQEDFEEVMRECNMSWDDAHVIYRIRHSDIPGYLVMRPIDNWRDVAEDPSFESRLWKCFQGKKLETLIAKYRSSVSHYSVNVLAALSDMSYFPKSP